MARRPSDATLGRSQVNPVKQSLLADERRLSFPHGIGALTQRRAKRIYDENPFLDQSQMEMVVRLVKLRLEFEEIHRTLQSEGRLIEDRYGHAKEHPAHKMLMNTHSACIAQERALAISISTRNSMISEQDREKPQSPGKVEPGVGGMPKLKLA